MSRPQEILLYIEMTISAIDQLAAVTSVKSDSHNGKTRRKVGSYKTPQDLTHEKHRSGKDEGDERFGFSGTVGNLKLVKPDRYSVMTSHARLW